MHLSHPHAATPAMRAIKAHSGGPETLLAAALRSLGITDFTRNDNTLPGAPDFSFPAARLAIFCDGCFWHVCPHCFRMPATRKSYWGPKLAANLARDERDNQQLSELGWLCARFFEHEIREDPQAIARRVEELRRMRLAG